VTHSTSTLEIGTSLRPSIRAASPTEESSHLSISSSANKAATMWTGRQLNPHRAAAVATYSGDSFLDIGCGNGQYVLHFKDKFETAGVDIQEYPQWAEAPKKFQVGDAARLPYDDASVDTILSFETLEHVPNPKAVLEEFHRVCRKNIIFSVPNCEVPSSLAASRLTFFHYTDRSHVNFFTRDSLTEMLVETGFRPQDVGLINACPTQPFLNELLALPSFLTRLVGKFAKKDVFRMTILAVASKG